MVDFFVSSRRRHTRLQGDWSSDVCSSDLRPGRITTIFVDHDTLMLQLANTGIGKFDPIPMSAESDREFFDPLHDTQAIFVNDAAGHVIEMVLRINGREFHAKKIK